MKHNWKKIAKDVGHVLLVCVLAGVIGGDVIRDGHPEDWFI